VQAAEQVAKQRKAPSRWLQRTSRTILGIIIVLLLLANLLLSNQVRIVVVDSEMPGSKVFLRDQATYTHAIQDALSDSILNGNKVTINTEAVAQKMRRQFPELAAVTITLPLVGRQPVVYMQPATPKLILTTTAGSSFVLDSTGRALLTGNQIAALSSMHLPVVNDQSGLEVDVQSTVLPGSTVDFITEVIAQLKAKKLEITSLVLPAGTSEVHLKTTGAGYVTKFNLQGSAREEAGSFLATKQYLESQHKTPAEYIDVRVENRVYYR